MLWEVYFSIRVFKVLAIAKFFLSISSRFMALTLIFFLKTVGWYLCMHHSFLRVSSTHLQVSDSDMVLVLSTEQEAIPSLYVVENKRFSLNATNPNRHIVAGVSLSQGLSLPFSRYSPHHGHDEFDYAWAIGDHPFGPFGASERLPPMMISNIRRNAILSRIYHGVELMRKTMSNIDQFAEVSRTSDASHGTESVLAIYARTT